MYFLVLIVLIANVLEFPAASASETGPDPKFILYSPDLASQSRQSQASHLSSANKLSGDTQAQVRGTKSASGSASGIGIKGTWPQKTVTSTTRDGYDILSFYMPSQIPQPSDQLPQAIAFFPDFFSNSEEYYASGGPCFPSMLTAAGYDVYCANWRGSEYCRTSNTSNWTQDKFWNYGPELHAYDVAAVCQTAMASTGAKKINVVCIGLGCLMCVIQFSLNPTFCSTYIKGITMISPTVFLDNVKPKCWSHIANDCGFWCSWQTICDGMGGNQFTMNDTWLNKMEVPCTSTVCKSCPTCALYTSDANYPSQLDPDYLSSRNYAANSAWTTKYAMVQFSQMWYNDKCMRYDFGYTGNMQAYGQGSPPAYQISKINVPVRIYAPQNDNMCQPSDTATLQSSLPNCVTTYTTFPTRMHMMGSNDYAAREQFYRTMMSTLPQ